MQIIPLKTLQDNYVWFVLLANATIVVDPGESEPVVKLLQTVRRSCTHIFITHHHHDHTGGVAQILQHYPQAQVFGPDLSKLKINSTTVTALDTIPLDDLPTAWQILETPGHTLDHICFYMPGVLFCGDTLFSAGCGRIFEGNPLQLYQSLQKITCLPDQTQLYPAHEYTQNNLLFAETIEPENSKIQQVLAAVKKQRASNQPTLPTTLNVEKLINPFLRCHYSHIQTRVAALTGKSCPNTTATFQNLRALRNQFSC